MADRKCYQFVEIVLNPESNEDEPKPITINGAAIRTPDEDIKWEEEQRELEANAPKGGKGGAKGKNKK